MINNGGMYPLKVYVETENYYFSQGIVSLLTEIFHDEGQNDIVVLTVGEVADADLVIQFNAPGEKASGWVDCEKFSTRKSYKHKILKKKWVSAYLSDEHYNRHFQCPMVNTVIILESPVAIIRQQLHSVYFSNSLCGPANLRAPDCGKCNGQYPLTSREQQLVDYLREGMGSAEVASLMGCSIKAISNYRRVIMAKLHIHKHSDFILWLGAKYIAEKYADIIFHSTCTQESNRLPCRKKSLHSVEFIADEKVRVALSMQRLTRERLSHKKSHGDVWLTTREIANAMDVSIYNMRYLLFQMKDTGKVLSAQDGKGRHNTLLWRLVR